LISIRRAEHHDLAEMKRLQLQASELRGRLDRRLIPGSESIDKFGKALQRMLGERSHRMFVAQEDGGDGLLGCVIGKVVDNRPFAVRQYGYIGCFCVAEGWHGQETGDRLFVAIRDWFMAEGLHAAQVDLAPRDSMGRRFWERSGFDHFLDHLYRDTEPEAKMVGDPEVVVRPAKAGDLDAVLSLWEEMMDYHAPFDVRLQVLPGGRAHTEQAMGYWLNGDAHCLLVAEAHDGVIGFALGGPVDTSLGLKPAVYGHIAHICVTARWRRRGIGRRLFGRLRDWFQRRGLSSIHIHVSHYSPVSQQFWRALGFEDYIERLWCDL
jgi:ribosomal protein S18 acetylase RimI-like enzyme